MNDHFAALGQRRRPWLEADELKESFHRLSASLHPDVPGSGDAAEFAAINAAYSVLREPAARLRHLIELTSPAALAEGAAPPIELGDLFMVIAALHRRRDDLLARRKAATSPLARALLAGEVSVLRRDFTAAQERIAAAESLATEEVRALDSSWSDSAAENADALTSLYHRLAYLTRWSAQIREALFTLGS